MAKLLAAELVDQLLQQRESVAEGRKVGDLAADMHMHAARIDAGKLLAARR